MDFETMPMYLSLYSYHLTYVAVRFPPVNFTKLFVNFFFVKFFTQNVFKSITKVYGICFGFGLLSVACSLVVIDFRHRAIVVPQPKPVRSQMNRVPTYKDHKLFIIAFESIFLHFIYIFPLRQKLEIIFLPYHQKNCQLVLLNHCYRLYFASLFHPLIKSKETKMSEFIWN